MRSYLIVSGLLAVLFFLSCSTSKPAIYTEPTIGSAAFDYWIHSPLHPEHFQPVTFKTKVADDNGIQNCLLYTSPSPRDATLSRMPSSA